MSIETGQGLTFDANFPKPHVVQSTQQFRDNFAILKGAIENLQIAKSDPTDTANVINVQVTQNPTTGAIRINSSYRTVSGSERLILPRDAAAGGAVGAIRVNFNSPHDLEYHNGTNWLRVVYKDTTGLVTLDTLTVNTRLTLNFTPTLATDAVHKGYVDQQLMANTAVLQDQIDDLVTKTDLTNDALTLESQTRISEDAAINLRIDELETAQSVADGNAAAMQGQLDNLANALSLEQTVRAAADANLLNMMGDLSNAVAGANTNVEDLRSELQDEILARQNGDQDLQNQIDLITGGNSTSIDQLVNDLDAETAARILGDQNLDTAIQNVIQSVDDEEAARIAADGVLQSQILEIAARTGNVHTYHQATEPQYDANANAQIELVSEAEEGDLWFDNAVASQLTLKRFSKGHIEGNGAVVQGVWEEMDLGVNTYFQATQPTSPHTGDLWIDSSSGQNVIKRYNGSTFDTISVSGNFVSKTGDTMSGDLTMNADIDVTGTNTLFIGGNDGQLRHITTDATYGGPVVRLTATNRSIVFDATGHIFLNPTGASSYFYIGTSTAQRFSVDASGNVQAQGDIGAMSDASLKTNVERVEGALDKLDLMRGVTFDRLDLDGQRGMGVIAQEVHAVVPELVKTGDDGKMSVAYGNMAALFIEAIKELRAEIAEIKKKLP